MQPCQEVRYQNPHTNLNICLQEMPWGNNILPFQKLYQGQCHIHPSGCCGNANSWHMGIRSYLQRFDVGPPKPPEKSVGGQGAWRPKARQSWHVNMTDGRKQIMQKGKPNNIPNRCSNKQELIYSTTDTFTANFVPFAESKSQPKIWIISESDEFMISFTSVGHVTVPNIQNHSLFRDPM